MPATPFYFADFTTMRHLPLFLILGFSPFLQGQELKISPTEELRVTVNEWVEAMRQIQQE